MLEEHMKICFVNYVYLCVLKFEERNKQITIENTFYYKKCFYSYMFRPLKVRLAFRTY